MDTKNARKEIAFISLMLQKALEGIDAEVCYQRGKCTSAYTVSRHMDDFNPLQLILKIALGMADELMRSDETWTSILWLKHRERCTEEISPYWVILVLRNLAYRLGYDDLIKALGADSLEYPEKIDCCGYSLAMASGKTMLRRTGQKLEAVNRYVFDGIVTTCPFWFWMFEGRQRAIWSVMGDDSIELHIFYYNQLLGRSIGFGRDEVGYNLNKSPVDQILRKIVEEDQK